MIAVLAGGVGAARFLHGLVGAVPPRDITVIGNTGDDFERYGLHISPDLDTVTYTVSENSNPDTGWGLRDETWTVMSAVGEFGDVPWFNLGDRDLGTHLFRTGRLNDGATLSSVTAEISKRFGLDMTLLPMTDNEVRTRLHLASGVVVDFQDYFVRLRHDVVVERVVFDGVESATPAPGVLEALSSAELIVIAPSNPILSIGPILAMAEVRSMLEARRDAVVAISPIVAGAALKGPADRLLVELGHESSAVGVARLLSSVAATLVIDERDAALFDAVAACGMRPIVTNTVMENREVAVSLAMTTIDAMRNTLKP